VDIKYFCHNNNHHDPVVIYLHGGPFFKIVDLASDPYVQAMYKNGFNVAALNYNINSGRGGKDDYMAILRELKTTFENSQVEAIVGDSYGGYLASLLSRDVICKTIVMSGFISLNYQRLFSTESGWLMKYLDKEAPDYLSNKGSGDNKISFIQGTKDQQCPFQQFLALKSGNERVILMKNFKHRETGSKLNQVIECLMTELGFENRILNDCSLI
jgi:dipeptidyl aminopeptidase/acylaminoacyl peptidase